MSVTVVDLVGDCDEVVCGLQARLE